MSLQTIAFTPGGVELNVIELDGAIDFSVRLRPLLVDGALFLPPRLRLGFDPDPPEGLFYVKAVLDCFIVPRPPDLFGVAGIDTGDDPT